MLVYFSTIQCLCFFQILQKEDAIEWPGTLAIVHSYISYKAGESSYNSKPTVT